MKEIELFFSRHTKLNKVIIISYSDNVEDIDVIKYRAPYFEYEVVLLDEFNESEIYKNLDAIDWDDAILCPYKVDCSVLLPLLKYTPKYVAGSVYEVDATAFLVWENARSFINEISLKVIREEINDLVFVWNRDTKSDCELSIVFPVYNVSKYLEKCLSTVTYWKAPYVEFLFVDDGSPDDSAKIIEKWAEKDDRIKLLRKENGGCASAREYGMSVAKGTYIGFVDPDDFVDVNMFHILLSRAMSGNFDISLCGYNEYYENTGKVKAADDALWGEYIVGCYDSERINELITYSRVAIWRGIYKREMLARNNIHFYTDLRRFDDLPFKVETFAYARSVVMTDKHMYFYRLEREGQDVAANDERLYVHFDIFKHLDESIGKLNNRKMMDYLQMCKLQTHRYALEKIKPEFKKEYVTRASNDLQTIDDYKRALKVTNILLGKEAANDYRRIVKKTY